MNLDLYDMSVMLDPFDSTEYDLLYNPNIVSYDECKQVIDLTDVDLTDVEINEISDLIYPNIGNNINDLPYKQKLDWLDVEMENLNRRYDKTKKILKRTISENSNIHKEHKLKKVRFLEKEDSQVVSMDTIKMKVRSFSVDI